MYHNYNLNGFSTWYFLVTCHNISTKMLRDDRKYVGKRLYYITTYIVSCLYMSDTFYIGIIVRRRRYTNIIYIYIYTRLKCHQTVGFRRRTNPENYITSDNATHRRRRSDRSVPYLYSATIYIHTRRWF